MISRRAFLLGTSALVVAPLMPVPPALNDWSWFWKEAATVFADEEYLVGKYLFADPFVRAIFTRVLTDNEIKQLNRDPYAPFRND